MKHRTWLLVSLAVAWAGVCDAQDIHKCVGIDGGGVAYQNAPCSGREIDAGLLRLPGYADPPQRDGATAPPADATQSMGPAEAPDASTNASTASDSQEAFPYRTSIALGMTDDQVLNISNWGRPSRIVRTGRHGGWRETWTYERQLGHSELSFIDGKLVGVS